MAATPATFTQAKNSKKKSKATSFHNGYWTNCDSKQYVPNLDPRC